MIDVACGCKHSPADASGKPCVHALELSRLRIDMVSMSRTLGEERALRHVMEQQLQLSEAQSLAQRRHFIMSGSLLILGVTGMGVSVFVQVLALAFSVNPSSHGYLQATAFVSGVLILLSATPRDTWLVRVIGGLGLAATLSWCVLSLSLLSVKLASQQCVFANMSTCRRLSWLRAVDGMLLFLVFLNFCYSLRTKRGTRRTSPGELLAWSCMHLGRIVGVIAFVLLWPALWSAKKEEVAFTFSARTALQLYWTASVVYFSVTAAATVVVFVAPVVFLDDELVYEPAIVSQAVAAIVSALCCAACTHANRARVHNALASVGTRAEATAAAGVASFIGDLGPAKAMAMAQRRLRAIPFSALRPADLVCEDLNSQSRRKPPSALQSSLRSVRSSLRGLMYGGSGREAESVRATDQLGVRARTSVNAKSSGNLKTSQRSATCLRPHSSNESCELSSKCREADAVNVQDAEDAADTEDAEDDTLPDVMRRCGVESESFDVESNDCDDEFDDKVATGQATRDLFKLTVKAKLGQIDAFVSHSWSDDPVAKWETLERWAQGFERKHGRTPLLWLDKACIKQSDIASDLACLPVFLSGCKELLVLAGSTYCERLWCVVEVFTFLKMGGHLRRIVLLPFAPKRSRTTDSAPISAADLYAGFASFDASTAKCSNEADRQRMLDAIEAGFGSIDCFSSLVSSIFGDASRPAMVRSRSYTIMSACSNVARITRISAGSSSYNRKVIGINDRPGAANAGFVLQQGDSLPQSSPSRRSMKKVHPDA